MLAPMRMAVEGLSAAEACAAVLRDNLHGLEIDRRCVELAAFALAFAAWRFPGAGGYRPLPELHLACCGLAVKAAREEWSALANGRKNLRIGLDWLYDEFRDAPVLGSLINPARSAAARIQEWETLLPALTEALSKEGSDERKEAEVTAQGLAKAAVLLSGKYHLVATNVPYLTRGRQDDTLREFCERRYSVAKNDLATVFLERCLEFCVLAGTTAIVLPQNWLFLASCHKLRAKLLKSETWNLVARLGPGAFETISGEVVNVGLLTISKDAPHLTGELVVDRRDKVRNEYAFSGIDAVVSRVPEEKAGILITGKINIVDQNMQIENSDARIILQQTISASALSEYVSFHNGMQTGDYPRFGRYYWEIMMLNGRWDYYQSTVSQTILYGGREGSLYWENGEGAIASSTAAVIRGTEAWKRRGISISAMGDLHATMYYGELYDENTVALIPKRAELLSAVWCFCSDLSYCAEVRKINQTLKVRGDLVKVPFDLDHWTQVAEEKYPNGLPKPYSDDPTQWIFHGHPARSERRCRSPWRGCSATAGRRSRTPTWNCPTRPARW